MALPDRDQEIRRDRDAVPHLGENVRAQPIGLALTVEFSGAWLDVRDDAWYAEAAAARTGATRRNHGTPAQRVESYLKARFKGPVVEVDNARLLRLDIELEGAQRCPLVVIVNLRQSQDNFIALTLNAVQLVAGLACRRV